MATPGPTLTARAAAGPANRLLQRRPRVTGGQARPAVPGRETGRGDGRLGRGGRGVGEIGAGALGRGGEPGRQDACAVAREGPRSGTGKAADGVPLRTRR